jgi:hypothetical protein
MTFALFSELCAFGHLLAAYTEADELGRCPYISIRVFIFEFNVPLTFADRFCDKTRKEKAFCQNLCSVSQ